MMEKKQLEELAAKLKTENGLDEITYLSAAGVEAFARTPTRAHFQRFQEQAADPKRRPRALETLVRSCILHPDPKQLDEALERRPGLVFTFGDKLLEMAGAAEETEAKKF